MILVKFVNLMVITYNNCTIEESSLQIILFKISLQLHDNYFQEQFSKVIVSL